MKNVLIVCAHYDDFELGCGGTAAKLSSNGCNVYKLVLTDNVTNFTQMNIKIDYESSKKESLEACKVLGAIELDEFEPVECCQLKYTTEVMQRLEAIIDKYNIDTVFTHYPTDINQDHVEASRITLTAARHCQNILYYNSNAYLLPGGFNPSIFINIEDFVDKKKEALSKYSNGHNRYGTLFDTAIHKNIIWGNANNMKCAEGFVPYKYTIE